MTTLVTVASFLPQNLALVYPTTKAVAAVAVVVLGLQVAAVAIKKPGLKVAAVALPGLKVAAVAVPGLKVAAVLVAVVQLFSQGRNVMYPQKMVCYTERFGIMSRKWNQISASNNTSFLFPAMPAVVWDGKVTLGPIPIGQAILN